MKGLSDKVVVGGFALALLLLGGVGGGSYLSVKKLVENRQWVEHTHYVLDTLNKIPQGMERADRGRRGYFILKSDSYLNDLRTGMQETRQAVAEAQQLTSDNPDQQQRLHTLEPLIARRLALFQQFVDLVRQNKLKQGDRDATLKQNLFLQQKIQVELQAIEQVERTLLQQRSEAIDHTLQLAVVAASVGSSLSFCLLVGIFLLLRREIRFRKQAEIALQAYVEEVYDLYNHAPCGYHSLDADGRFIRINETELAWLGYTRDEILHQKTFVELTTAQSALAFQEHFPNFKEQGWISDVEFELIRKDGTLLPVSLSATTVKDAEGNFLMSRSTTFDISDRKQTRVALQQANERLEARVQERTAELSQVNALLRSELLERKQAEQALAQSEKQLRLITDAMPVLISYIDAERRFRFNNQAYKHWFGYDRATLYGQHLQEVVGEAAYQKIEPYVEAVLSGQEVSYESSLPYKNGGMRWVKAIYIPDFGEQGAVKGYFALISDITERKQSEEALRESKERLSFALETAALGDWDLNLRDRTAARSLRHDQIFGYDCLQNLWTYEKFLKHVLPDDRAAVDAKFGAALADNKVWDFECRIRRIDGVIRWVWSRGHLYQDAQGDTVRMLGLIADITDRKQAEQALADSEKQLRTLTDALPVLISYIDSDHRYCFNNRAYEHWFGHSGTTTHGQHLSQVLGEAAYQSIQPYLERVMTGETVNYERPLPYRDGGTRWVSAIYIPDFDDEGTVKGCFALVSDITDRKQAEEAVRQSEERLLWVLQNMPVMLDAFDENGNVIVWNHECERVTGYHADEIVGNPRAMELLYPHPVYRQQMRAAWAECGSNYRNWEWEIVCKDGSVKTVSWSNISDEFSISGWATWGIGVDVTDRKQAEAALRESQQRLSLAIEGSGMATWDIDLLTEKALWSTQHFELLGYEPVPSGEATLDMWRRCAHPDDLERVIQITERAIQERSLYRSEHRIIRADNGQVVWLAAFGRALYNEAGQPVRFIGIILNISDRKQVELALQQAKDGLERQVQERTAALSQSNDDLRRSNQELEQFAYVASHDLQEPLRAIMGYTQLLTQDYRDRLDDTAQGYGGYIVDGAKRMQQLIQDLLHYSRTGTRDLVFAPTDCKVVLEQVLGNLQVAIAERSAIITYDPLPTVTADGTQLAQLLQNLIGNAIKFCREEQPQVHVSVERQEDEWRFGVRDNGIGIKPRYLERIFEIFKRLHTRTEFPGTGIGLAICKKIVDRHNGRIWAESEPGTGTTFYFTLPDYCDLQ